jgi:hypothetical protein
MRGWGLKIVLSGVVLSARNKANDFMVTASVNRAAEMTETAPIPGVFGCIGRVSASRTARWRAGYRDDFPG